MGMKFIEILGLWRALSKLNFPTLERGDGKEETENRKREKGERKATDTAAVPSLFMSSTYNAAQAFSIYNRNLFGQTCRATGIR